MFSKPKENINDVALEYMEQKYGGKFEYYAPFGNSMSGTHQLLVRCDSFPDQDILVRVENYKKDDKVFLDNYLAVKYHNDTVNFIIKCADKVFTEADVYCDVVNQVLSADLSANATFEEYMSDTKVPLHIMLEVKASNFDSEDQVQEVAELLGAYGCRYYLSVMIYDNSKFGSGSSSAFEKRMVSGDYLRCAKIIKSSEKTEIKWLKEE